MRWVYEFFIQMLLAATLRRAELSQIIMLPKFYGFVKLHLCAIDRAIEKNVVWM